MCYCIVPFPGPAIPADLRGYVPIPGCHVPGDVTRMCRGDVIVGRDGHSYMRVHVSELFPEWVPGSYVWANSDGVYLVCDRPGVFGDRHHDWVCVYPTEVE